MKLYTFFLLFASVLLSNVYGQTNDNEVDKELLLKNKLSIAFSNVISGNSFSNLGSFAALDTDESSVSASVFFVTEENRMITLKASGGATQGIAALFDEGKINSNVSLEASLHFLSNFAPNGLSIDNTALSILENKLKEEDEKYERDVFYIDNKKDILDALDALAKIQKKINTLQKGRKKIADSIINLGTVEDIKNKIEDLLILSNKTTDEKKVELTTLRAKREMIIQVIPKLKSQLKDIEGRIKIAQYDEKSTSQKVVELQNAIRDKLVFQRKKELLEKNQKTREEIEELKAKEIMLNWFTIQGGIRNDAFKLFNDTLTVDQQIKSEEYTTLSISASYNILRNAKLVKNDGGVSLKSTPKLYLSLGGLFNYSSNLKSLAQVEVVDVKQILEEPNRQSIKRQNAFAGNYEEDLASMTTYIDYYNFFTKENKVAIHLNPVMLFRENLKPIASLNTGIVLTFRDRKKASSIVNLEVFYNLNDIFNTNDTNNSILNRNTVGVRTTFPLKF